MLFWSLVLCGAFVLPAALAASAEEWKSRCAAASSQTCTKHGRRKFCSSFDLPRFFHCRDRYRCQLFIKC